MNTIIVTSIMFKPLDSYALITADKVELKMKWNKRFNQKTRRDKIMKALKLHLRTGIIVKYESYEVIS